MKLQEVVKIMSSIWDKITDWGVKVVDLGEPLQWRLLWRSKLLTLCHLGIHRDGKILRMIYKTLFISCEENQKEKIEKRTDVGKNKKKKLKEIFHLLKYIGESKEGF